MMAYDVIQLYISLISQYFTLSDMAVNSPSESSSTPQTPPFVPQNSHSLTTAYYLTRILAEIQECVNETVAMEVSNDASAGLRSLLESARWRFEGALTGMWLRGTVFLAPSRRH